MSIEHVSWAVFPALAKMTILAANQTALVDEAQRTGEGAKKKKNKIILQYCKKSRAMRSVEKYCCTFVSVSQSLPPGF